MALVRDTNGTQWSVRRRLWPFPGDALDLTFGWFEGVLAALFALLWPFWWLTKFLGARWVIVIEREGNEVGRELVRGWRKSKKRINEIAVDVASGRRSGPIGRSGPIVI
jgi:hypothetical protein